MFRPCFFVCSPLTVRKFDLKFTKGNTVVEPHKLMYLQKKYAAKYADENGPQFRALVDRLFEEIQQEFKAPSWHPNQTYSLVSPIVMFVV